MTREVKSYFEGFRDQMQSVLELSEAFLHFLFATFSHGDDFFG